jgi:hypothetical protein
VTDKTNDPLILTVEAQDGTVLVEKPVLLVEPGTCTGRQASEPNLQNIPIRTETGQKVREAFLTALCQKHAEEVGGHHPLCECGTAENAVAVGPVDPKNSAALNLLKADGDAQADAMTDVELEAAVAKEREAEATKRRQALTDKLLQLLDERDLTWDDFPGLNGRKRLDFTGAQVKALVKKAFDKEHLLTASTIASVAGFRHVRGSLRAALKSWMRR